MFDASPASQQAWTAARYPDLAAKTVFISGGATGIGASLVAAFAAQGAQVYFIDIDADAGEALARQFANTPNPPKFQRCDVTDTTALQTAIDAAQALNGRLDAMINNAANDKRHDPETATPEFFDWCVAINFKHQFFAAQRAFHWMKRQGSGSIINFGSVSPRIGQADLAIYGAMKSAVSGFTRSLSKAFGPQGVRVNAIVPGVILTPKQLELWITPEIEAAHLENQHLKRRLVGDDIAPTALFLASDASNAIASQSFAIDAGLTAAN
ncbi:MAG: SDR family oxidoreductase [Neomegalonema sp.]|nr:SDR family oxidoreductase [Neomegalonema sp.]